MHQLEFGRVHDYSSGDEAVAIPVELRSGSSYVTQGEAMDELSFNLSEAIEACLAVPVESSSMHTDDLVIELAL
jgi:hypothetical protein